MSGNYYCSVCGKPATVCKKETINGVTKVSYYCDDCYQAIESGNPFDNLISAMFNFNGTNSGLGKPKTRTCKCGMTERDVISGGKFGCSECYTVFRDIAENFVNTRGYLAHKGKIPHKSATNSTQSGKEKQQTASEQVSELSKLKAELSLAVKEERYLDADRIAKQIAKLNGEAR